MPIICIVGVGRSGSTLLDRILGSLPGLAAVGESRSYWARSLRGDSLCGCGEPLATCPSWARVAAGAFGGERPDFATEVANERRLMARRNVARLVAGRRLPGDLDGILDQYAAVRRRWYEAVLQEHGATTIVDSTKFPLYALLLAASGQFDVRAVHLVRDPRGVAFSRTKLRANPTATRSDATQWRLSPFGMAWRWAAYNIAAEAIARRRMRYLRLRYEDLVMAPTESTRRILRFASVEGPEPKLDDGVIDLLTHHTIGSNPSVRGQVGATAIRVDDEWRRALPARAKALVTAATLPVLLRHGYPVSWRR